MTEKPDMENAGTLTPPCCLAVWSSLARTDSHGLLLLAPCNCNEKDIRSNQEAWKSNRFKQARKLEVLHLFRWLTHTHHLHRHTKLFCPHLFHTHPFATTLSHTTLSHTQHVYTYTNFRTPFCHTQLLHTICFPTCHFFFLPVRVSFSSAWCLLEDIDMWGYLVI